MKLSKSYIKRYFNKDFTKMNQLCAVIDAQGFAKDSKFYPRVIAVAFPYVDKVLCWDCETGLDFHNLSSKDRITNSYIRHYTGLPFEAPEDAISHDKVSVFLGLLYDQCKYDDKIYFGIKNPQFGQLLSHLRIPTIEVECPSTSVLARYYKKERCSRHVENDEGMCSVRKVELIREYLNDKLMYNDLINRNF